MKKSTEIAATNDNLYTVIHFIEEQLESVGCPERMQMQIHLAVEEIFVNIASYAYAPETGMAGITIDISDHTATITFEDSGAPFDPLAMESPDVTLPAKQRRLGGLGIFMVRKLMDDVRYEYCDGKNRLTIVKEIPKE